MNRQNVALLLACALITAGVVTISWRAGLIVAGILLAVLVFTSEW